MTPAQILTKDAQFKALQETAKLDERLRAGCESCGKALVADGKPIWDAKPLIIEENAYLPKRIVLCGVCAQKRGMEQKMAEAGLSPGWPEIGSLAFLRVPGQFDEKVVVCEKPANNGDVKVLVQYGRRRHCFYLANVANLRPRTGDEPITMDDRGMVPYGVALEETLPDGTVMVDPWTVPKMSPEALAEAKEAVRESSERMIMPRDAGPRFVENVGDRGILPGERGAIVGFSENGEILQVWRAASVNEPAASPAPRCWAVAPQTPMDYAPTLYGHRLHAIPMGSVVVVYFPAGEDLARDHLLGCFRQLRKDREDLLLLALPDTFKAETASLDELRIVRDRLNEVIYDRENGK